MPSRAGWLREAPLARLDCTAGPLAESTCRVVPGSPVIRWKWSPAWPVATQNDYSVKAWVGRTIKVLLSALLLPCGARLDAPTYQTWNRRRYASAGRDRKSVV